MGSLITNPVVGFKSGPDDALWYCEPYMDSVTRNISGKKKYLYKTEVNQQKVFDTLRLNPDIDVLLLNGHGDAYTYLGYHSRIVFSVTVKSYPFSWRGKKIIALSCYTAGGLGKDLVKRGASAYIGFNKSFILNVTYGSRKTRKTDWFLKPIETAMIKLGNGEWTPQQAYSHIYNEYTKLLEDPSIPAHIKKDIRHNRDALQIIPPKPVIPVKPPKERKPEKPPTKPVYPPRKPKPPARPPPAKPAYPPAKPTYPPTYPPMKPYPPVEIVPHIKVSPVLLAFFGTLVLTSFIQAVISEMVRTGFEKVRK